MPTDTQHDLPRVLSVRHATSIVVGIIIGSGIFLVPQEMMIAVGSATKVYAVWIVGGLLSLAGALTYAEIAAARPAYGGEYAFLREAYGDLVAFLHMWTWFTIAKPASLASICAGLVRTLALFPVFAFFTNSAIGFLTWGQVAALVALWSVTLLDIVGTRRAANVQLALTWLKVVLIVLVAAVCFLAAGPIGTMQHFTTTFAGAHGGFGGFMVALIAALWAYDGWSDVAPMAGEVERPQRNLPIALAGGTLAVAALYMLTNAAIQYVLPAASIAASERPAVSALQRVLLAHHLGFGAELVAVGMIVSITSSFVGSSLSGARILFAAARDGLFFRGIARVNPRFQTPAASLVVQACLASVLVLALGRFQRLFSLAIFADWMTYGLAASTIFIFRRRDAASGTARPFSTPLYPFVPLLFVMAAAVVTVFSILDKPVDSLLGMLVIALGIPLYLWFAERRVALPS
ncbi:APC family permease [Terriglobus sp.]|uniref:APC family permease n=1 Tax=Terriglobus sp. TaxID=1889013 RepID=UPI003AFFBD04